MSVEALDQYVVLVSLTFLFTVLALIFDEETWKKITLQICAGVSWFVLAIGHFIVGDSSSLLTIPLTYLFAAFGMIFIIASLYNSIQAMRSGGY